MFPTKTLWGGCGSDRPRATAFRSRSSVIAVFSQFFQHRSKDFLFNLCQHLVCANMLATCQRIPKLFIKPYGLHMFTPLLLFFFVWVCVDTEQYFCMFNGFQAQHGVLVELLTAMVGCVLNGACHPNGHFDIKNDWSAEVGLSPKFSDEPSWGGS